VGSRRKRKTSTTMQTKSFKIF